MTTLPGVLLTALLWGWGGAAEAVVFFSEPQRLIDQQSQAGGLSQRLDIASSGGLSGEAQANDKGRGSGTAPHAGMLGITESFIYNGTN